MKLLDLAKMKKVESDGKTSTFMHEKGHKMVILHAALPKIMQEQIKRLPLAGGGEVKGVHEDLEKEQPLLRGRSAAGTVTRLANEEGPYQEPAKKRAKELHGKKLEEIREMKHQDRKYLADGTPSGTVDDTPGRGESSDSDNPSGSDDSSAPQAQTPPSVGHQISSPVAPITINVGQGASPAVQAPQAPAAPQVPQASPLEQQAQTTLDAAKLQQQAPHEQEAVEAAKAQAQIPIEQQQIENAKEIQIRQQKTVNDMKQHTDEFAQYMGAHPVNPRAYGQDQTGYQKMQTALGLALGGLAGGGTSNLALDFLNKQIDRDIDAQKTNRAGSESVFHAYQQLYNDENVSTNLTKVSMNDRLIHQANLAAAQLGTAQAKANADALSSKLTLDNAQLRMDAAAILNSRSGDSNKLPGDVGAQAGLTPEEGGYKPVQILAPGAIQKSLGLAHSKVFDNDKLKSQLTRARQAEKVINGPKLDGVGGIEELMDDMYHAIDKGSWVGGLEQRMKSGIGHVPFVGGSAEGLSNIVAQGAGYKTYTKNAQQLKSDIGSALHGVIAPSELDKMVDPFLPTLGDTPDDVKNKVNGMVQTIIKALPLDELENAHLTAAGAH